jgi:hypothetical protein
MTSKQDFKIYGKEYDCFCRGVFLGKGIWTDDENVGEEFLRESTNKQGEMVYQVLRPDEWYFSLT